MAKTPRSQIILFDYAEFRQGNVRGRQARQRKDGTRGKGRVTVELESKPILMDLDNLALGQGPAHAIRDILQQKGRAITQKASESTLATRIYQEAAYSRGAAWARKRFEGGRTGFKRVTGTTKSGKQKTVAATPPVPGADKLFNHSGRMFGGLSVNENKKDGGWTVNVPANRFDPSTFPSVKEFKRMLSQLQALVPELKNPAMLLGNPKLEKAIKEAFENVIMVGELNTSAQKLQQLQEARKRAVSAALDLLRVSLGVGA